MIKNLEVRKTGGASNNAIKFTTQGRVRVALSRIDRDGKSTLQVSVEDTGIGIRAEDQLKLFTAFSRVTAQGSSMEEGTGLGLHLSQSLAALLGGGIALHSEYAKGSTFTLLLPELST